MNEQDIVKRLATPPPIVRMEDILNAPDAREQVRCMDALTLYYLVLEVGTTTASPLIQLASSEQVQSFWDIDCWNRERVDMDRLAQWLAIMLQGDDDWFAGLLRGVDLELITLFLKHHLQVYDWNEEQDSKAKEPLEDRIEPSPDGVYLLVLPEDQQTADLLRRLLDRLYQADQDLARQLLAAARHELTSVLEETAYQLRNGRLEEFGFLPADEAAAIFARVDPTKLRRSLEAMWKEGTVRDVPLRLEQSIELPAVISRELLALAVQKDSYWGLALARSADLEPQRRMPDKLLRQIVHLVNQSIMAEHTNPRNLEEVPWALRRVHGFLNIGLQYVTRRDPTRAVDFLAAVPTKTLFQVGFSLALSLKEQAQKLIGRGHLSLVEELSTSLCTPQESELISGLIRHRPLPAAEREEGFQTLEEIEHAAAVLTLLAYKELWTFDICRHTKTALLEILLGPPATPVPIDQITFDCLLATRAAIRLLDTGETFRLLDLEEIQAIRQDYIRSDSLSPRFTESLLAAARPSHAEVHPTSLRMAEKWASIVAGSMVEEYGGLTPDAFRQPRFLPGLLLFRAPPPAHDRS